MADEPTKKESATQQQQKGNQSLRNQTTDDAAQAVKEQREAKKREKEAKKLAARAKEASGGGVEAAAKMGEAEAGDDNANDTQTKPQAKPASGVTASAADEPKEQKGNTALRDQSSEEAVEAVAKQREAKKREKEAKKLAARAKEQAAAAAAQPADEGTVQTPDTTPAPTTTAASSPSNQEPTKPAALKGQTDEAAAQAVADQREAKKREKEAKKQAAREKEQQQQQQDPPASGGGKTPAAKKSGGAQQQQPKTNNNNDNGTTTPVKQKVGKGGAPAESASAAPAVTIEAPQPPPPTTDFSFLHPRVAEVGALFRSKMIIGTNARCLSVIAALRCLVTDSPLIASMRSPFQSEDIDKAAALIQKNVDFLSSCRELPGGIHEIVQLLKDRAVRHVGQEHRGETPRQYLLSQIDELEEDVVSAFEDTVQQGLDTCIKDNDVILTFGRSSSIEVLLLAAVSNRSFSVIVADSAPMYEGRSLYQKLQQAHIKVTYVLLSAICTAIPRCSKVLIGANSVMQNGEVQSRAGTAMVALVAHRHRKPVFCLCETYKFTSKVRLGSLTVNQKHTAAIMGGGSGSGGGGGAASLAACCGSANKPGASSSRRSPAAAVEQESAAPHLAAADEEEDGYLYDLTPPTMVSMFVTEVGNLHPTAVAAVVFDRVEREETKGGN